MTHLHPHKVGLALGAVVGILHLVWSLLVAAGFAQPLINFIFEVHMIQPIFIVAPFSVVMAFTLVVITSVIGYVVGSVFSLIWNKLHRAA